MNSLKGFLVRLDWRSVMFLVAAALVVVSLAGCPPLPPLPPPPPPPAAPVGVAVTAVTTGDRTVAVSWSQDKDAASYNVYWKQGSSSPRPAGQSSTATHRPPSGGRARRPAGR